MVPQEQEPDPLIGETLGGLYRIVALLGEGGMGRVYEAVHQHLGKRFAIKVLSEGRADKPGAPERFLREARSATQIEHEHIVEVVNFDTDDQGRVFIVMELLQGESLAERLTRGPLPIDEAVELSAQAASALQAAHDAGIVHRDLKPENIFITKRHGRDFVKVLDFGISKIKDADHPDVRLTATDQILGTPLYISPELAKGETETDHRADIYALGVITYEMLTGVPPFSGKNQFQLLWHHGNTPPELPSARDPALPIPSALDAAVMKALEKDPDDRYARMDELGEALQEAVEPQRSPRDSPALRWGWITTMAFLAVVATVFYFRDHASPGTETPPDEAAAPQSTAVPAPSPAPVRAIEPTPVQPAPPAAPAPKPAPRVEIRVESEPPGAKVRLDGEPTGSTPLLLELEPDREAVVGLSLSGYRSEKRSFVPEQGMVLSVRLKKRTADVRRKKPPIKLDF